MPNDEKVSGVKISTFPVASSIASSDLITGLHNRVNTNFSLSAILAWFRNTVEDFYIPASAKGSRNGVATLNQTGVVPSDQLDLSNKQDKITASGILKGNGAGGVSAATAGTDYGTYSKPSGGIPASDLASGVVPSASDATPQALGTAAAGSSNDYSRADHVHQMPEIPSNVEANPSGAATDTLTKLQVDQTIYAVDGIDYLTVVNGQICVVYEVTP